MTTNTTNNQTTPIIQITEYSIDSFVFKIQEYIKQGYKVSDRIEGYPIQAGVAFYCMMLEDKDESAVPKSQAVKVEQGTQEVKQPRQKKS